MMNTQTTFLGIRIAALSVIAAVLVSACGGSGSSGGKVHFPAQPASDYPVVKVSQASPFPTSCPDSSGGKVFQDAEVEPKIAVDPADPQHLVAVWQQDRWSNGGAHGALAAVSFDGGSTWQLSAAPPTFSLCAGGTGVYGDDRSSDPWVSIGADGTVYFMVLTFTGDTFAQDSTGTMMVSRSLDGGLHWEQPSVLIDDSSAYYFNDKNAITADPTDASKAYAVWDRLTSIGGGPTMLSRTLDGGASWSTAVPIYTPGTSKQTIANQIVVLPDGTLVDMFVELDNASDNPATPAIKVIRSVDSGATWSAPVPVTDMLAVGTADPTNGDPVRDAAFVPDIAAGADGSLTIVWQDGRFSNGLRDGVALSRSTDGGLSWSAPVQINAEPSVQAFVPTVRVLPSGIIGVTYYDFRDDTPADSLPTDVWLAWSTDGVSWQESQILGPFDLATAPVARGYFLGDYQGLAGVEEHFVPLLVQSYPGATSNRTDVFALQVYPALTLSKRAYAAVRQPIFDLTPAFAAKVQAQAQLRREYPPQRQ